MKAFSSGLAAHLAGVVTTLCRCWRLARKDAMVMGFTDHGRDIVFDGVTYQAATGFAASAIEDQLGLAVSNLDVDGALSSAATTEVDIHAGRYDDAEVIVFLVNWADPAQRVVLRKGYLGQIERGELASKAELRGLASRLDQVAGRIFQRTCRWELGDARCGVDLDSPEHHGAGTVAQVFDAFDFTATGLDSFATGVCSRGKLTWMSGANAGLPVEVKAHAAAGSVARISLFLPVPEPIEVGDTFMITAGCDKSFDTCLNRFNNVINFGGFPHIPGNDFVLSYPTQGSDNDGERLG